MILKDLSAQKIDFAKNIEPQRGVSSSVHAEVAPGVFLHVHLSHEGIVLKRDRASVGIPLNDLITLAVTCNPQLALSSEPAAPAPAAHDDHFAGK